MDMPIDKQQHQACDEQETTETIVSTLRRSMSPPAIVEDIVAMIRAMAPRITAGFLRLLDERAIVTFGVQGNIGAGKSTALNKFLANEKNHAWDDVAFGSLAIGVCQEPIQHEFVKHMLAQQTADPDRNAFAFQVLMLSMRIMTYFTAIFVDDDKQPVNGMLGDDQDEEEPEEEEEEEEFMRVNYGRRISPGAPRAVLFERSVDIDRVFAAVQASIGKMSEHHYAIYYVFSELVERMFSVPMAGTIYIRRDTRLCHASVNVRARKEEMVAGSSVSADNVSYLDRLNMAHDIAYDVDRDGLCQRDDVIIIENDTVDDVDREAFPEETLEKIRQFVYVRACDELERRAAEKLQNALKKRYVTLSYDQMIGKTAVA